MTNDIIKETGNIQLENLALQYLVHEPKIKAGKSKAIILLHGVGSNENDLLSLANQLPNDCFIISSRGQFTLSAGRYAWYNVDFSTGKPLFNKEQELSSRKVIATFIEQVKQKYNLDEVYLGGFSQGAIMSYTIGLTKPKAVQGIIALSGRILDEIKPTVTTNDDLQRLKVFIAHGVQDGTLPIDYAREAKSYLQSVQVPIDYHEYQMGHQINPMVVNDLRTWLASF